MHVLFVAREAQQIDPAVIEAFVMEGMDCQVCEGGAAGLRLIEEERIPVVVIAYPLKSGPDTIDTLAFITRARSLTDKLIFVYGTATAARVEEFYLTNVDRYVSDVTTTPRVFALDVRAFLNRCLPESDSELHVGDIHFDLQAQCVSVGGSPVKIGPADRRVLEFLMRRAGMIVSRWDMASRLLGKTFGETRAVDLSIVRIREALGGPLNKYIETIRGSGYRLRPLAPQ